MERRAFAFYKECTASRLLSLVDGDFWSRVALQASYREESVRRMLAAHSLRDEAMTSAAEGRGKVQQLRDLATTQYWKAIARVRDQGRSIDINCLLIAIVLFASFDAMNGDYIAASKHANSVVQIGKAFMQSGCKLTDNVARIVIYRANMAASLENANLQPLTGKNPPSESRSVQDIRAAVAALEGIKGDILASATMCWAHPSDLSARESAVQCRERLKLWFETYEHCTVSAGWTCGCPVSYLELAPSYLEAWYRFLLQELQTAIDPNTTSDDQYNEEFRTIITPCEGFLNTVYHGKATIEAVESCLGFKTSCIPLLTLAGLRCRQPQLRRYTIRVLRWWSDISSSPRADVYADLVNCLMRLEEANVYPNPVVRSSDIGVAARLHLVQITCMKRESPTGAFIEEETNPTHFKVAIVRRAWDGTEAEFGEEFQIWNRKGEGIVLPTQTTPPKAGLHQPSTLVPLYRQLL